MKRTASVQEYKIFSNTALRKLILPLVVEQALAASVGIFDTMMVSSLGESAVSGVSLVDMICLLMINIFAALATGGAVICAREIGFVRIKSGSSDYSSVRVMAKHLLLISGSISCLLAVVCYFLRAPLLNLLFGTLEAETMDSALTYFAIVSVSFPFIALYNAFAALFRTTGESGITMKASLIVNVVNICGNALLIFGFGMGVAGAAISTTVSRFVGMLILGVIIANKKRDVYIDYLKRFKVSLGTIKRMLGIGIPNGLENGFFTLGRILVISMISGFGEIQLAANSVANNFDTLGCIPGHAVCLAMVTVVGQCIGAGDLDAANYYRKKLMKMSFLLTAIIEIAIIVSLPLTLRFYDLSAETLKLAAILITIHDGLAIFLWSPSFVTPNALRAAGDVRFTMIVSISSMICFRLLFSYIIGVRFGLGIIGVWIAMVLDWIFRGSMFAWRVHSGKWLSHIPKPEQDSAA